MLARTLEHEAKNQNLRSEKKALNAGILRALDFKVAAGKTQYWCQESFFDEVGNHDTPTLSGKLREPLHNTIMKNGFQSE